MGPVTSVFGLVLVFLGQTIALEPEFPKIPDDFIATGTLRYPHVSLKLRLSVSVSKSLKASITEVKSYGMKEKNIKLEKYGSNGALIKVAMNFGNSICYLTEGTPDNPVDYMPYYLQNVKYVGTEKVNGLEMQKWKFSGGETSKKTGTLLIREDKNGPFIHRVDTDKVSTVTFETFTPKSPSPSVFKYDKNECEKINLGSMLEY